MRRPLTPRGASSDHFEHIYGSGFAKSEGRTKIRRASAGRFSAQGTLAAPPWGAGVTIVDAPEDLRRSQRTGAPASSVEQADLIWMDGRLVAWDDAKVHL